jgi:hypothetical protein
MVNGPRSSYVDFRLVMRLRPSVPNCCSSVSPAPSRFMLEGVFALRGPAQRSTTTSILPRLLSSSGERRSGASSVNSVCHQLYSSTLRLSSPLQSASNVHSCASIVPSFCLSSFWRTRKFTSERRLGGSLSFNSCLLRLH